MTTVATNWFGWNEGRRRQFQWILEQVQRRERGHQLIDVGCSGGFFLKECQAAGYVVAGLEPSRQAAERARAELGIPIIEASLEEAQLPEDTYDVASLNNVLEHFPDPLQALKKIRRSLRPGGLFTVSVPNVIFAQIAYPVFDRARAFGIPSPLDHIELMHAPNHLYAFSPRTLRGLLTKAGFEAIEMHPEVPVGDTRAVWHYTKQAQYQVARLLHTVNRGLITGHGITAFAKRSA